MQMHEHINKKVDMKMQITDVNLTERFIDGIRDRVVRQELRKIVVEQSTIPFQVFRLRMLKSVDDNPPCENIQVNVASAIVNNSDPLTDMLQTQQAMLEKQQQQIDTLAQTLEKFQQPDFHRRGSRPNRGFVHNRGTRRPAQVICYACNGQGHFASECANRKKRILTKQRKQKTSSTVKAKISEQ